MSVRNHQVLRVPVEKLKLGMTVIELDQPWIESPFTVYGFKIKSNIELDLLRKHCSYVYIAVKKTIDTTADINKTAHMLTKNDLVKNNIPIIKTTETAILAGR